MNDSTPTPKRGMLVRDHATGKVGLVMDTSPRRLHLRPVGGGIEWEADTANVEILSVSEGLRDAVREINESGSRRDIRRW